MSRKDIKFDAILSAIEKLNEKVDRIEDIMDNFKIRLSQVESKLNERIEKVEKETVIVPTIVNNYEKLKNRVHALEIINQQAQNENIMRDSYSKSMNLLIHGLDESSEAWESKSQTRDTLSKFFSDGLQLDFNHISLVDYHRLPQRPIFKREKKITRPLIIKFANVFDKQALLHSAKNLKSYNSNRNSSSNNTQERNRQSVYITDHLPKLFYQQKKELMPLFREARSDNKKTRWAIENGSYCLYVNETKHTANHSGNLECN